jgi:putative PIN family toxin of toxin-antitoxin system
MKVVFDTNVLIAAVISRGLCFEIFEHAIKNHEVYYSNYIKTEVAEKLQTKFKFSKTECSEAIDLLFERLNICQPERYESESLVPDADDIEVIGTAISSKCTHLITGDKALQKLIEIEGVKIVSPSDFWKTA